MDRHVSSGFVSALPARHPGGKFRYHRDPTCPYVADSPTLTEVVVIDSLIWLPPGPRSPGGRRITAIAAKCCRTPTTNGWCGLAACTSHPKQWWLKPELATMDRAKAVCRQCAVRVGCLAAAPGDDPAIWGGLTEQERACL